MLKNSSGFILKIVMQIECKFNCLAYAYLDEITKLWHICCDDYELYANDEIYKEFRAKCHNLSKERGVKIVFCYCNPTESQLINLIDNNLIMNL
jgi:hypothetical protein